MAYSLIITDRANELLDNCISHILNQFKNEQAAKHLLNEIEKIYDRLESNPFQFLDCKDDVLKEKGYKEAVIVNMDYVIIFRIEDETIYILGIFHQLENFETKIV